MRNPHNDSLGDRQVSLPSGALAPDAERRCLLTGESFARAELIRLAIAPTGEVLPDVLARAPGRGAWIMPNRPALETAIGNGKLRGAMLRSFKGEPVKFDDKLPGLIETALTRALLDRLGLALKAGHLLLGAERIDKAARLGQVRWLAHASDAAEDGMSKRDASWRVGEDLQGGGLAGIRLPLDREALSVALGRENVVHLALTDPKAAAKIDQLASRLLQYNACENTQKGAEQPASAAMN